MRPFTIGIAALAVLVLLTACGTESGSGPKGSGVETSSRRETTSFSRVDLRGAARVSIVVGRARSVTVRGDDNLTGRVETKVEGDTLAISTRSYRSEIGISVEIGVPALDGIELSGSGTIGVHKLSGASFSADLSGLGKIRIDGQTAKLVVDISGSGEAQLDRLSALAARVDISGLGDVSLTATNSLEASISGSGDITYAGNPRRVAKDVSGSGSISAQLVTSPPLPGSP